MARSSPCAELESLTAIERHWRDALSWVAAGEVESAAAELDEATQLLASVGAVEELRTRLDDEQLVTFAARTERLRSLHGALQRACEEAQSRLRDELGSAQRSRDTIDAYADQLPVSHACDTIA